MGREIIMDRKAFTAVLDETFSKMEEEVRVLKTQKQTLTINVNELQTTRDKLSNEILSLENKHTETLIRTKGEVDSLLKSATDKLTSASLKESRITSKLSELDQKIKEADNLIKSNQGLQKSVSIQNEESKNKILKIGELTKYNQEVLKNL